MQILEVFIFFIANNVTPTKNIYFESCWCVSSLSLSLCFLLCGETGLFNNKQGIWKYCIFIVDQCCLFYLISEKEKKKRFQMLYLVPNPKVCILVQKISAQMFLLLF